MLMHTRCEADNQKDAQGQEVSDSSANAMPGIPCVNKMMAIPSQSPLRQACHYSNTTAPFRAVCRASVA